MNNSTPPDKPQEQAQLSEVYQQLDKPTPGAQLDEKILAQARRAMQKNAQSTNKTKSWRKWQWPTSIAAGAAFVSVIVFTQYEQFEPILQSSDLGPTDIRQIAEQASIDDKKIQQRSRLEKKSLTDRPQTSAVASQAMPNQEQFNDSQIDEPELSNYAEQEAQTLAAKALEGIEIDIAPIQSEVDLQLITGLNSEAREQADDKLEARREAKQAAPIRADGQGASQLLNTAYLDDMLSRYQQAQQNAQSADSPAKRTAFEQQQMQIRHSMFEYLALLKTAQPNIDIADKFLSVLSPEQQRVLQQKP